MNDKEEWDVYMGSIKLNKDPLSEQAAKDLSNWYKEHNYDNTSVVKR